jgi:hippurate hydrolase
MRPPVRDQVGAAVTRIADGIAATFGMRAEVHIRHGAASTKNSPAEAALAAAAAEAAGLAVRRDLPPSMASEDFGWYLEERPGTFAWIGNGSGADLHNPDYDFNDAILPAAATWLSTVARQSLKG